MAVKRSWRAILTMVVVVAAMGGSAVEAQQMRAEGPTPPRLSFVDGDVSYWRPGADDWAPAQINTALGAGDSLYAANGANVEVEIGSRAFIRAGSGTELGIESLETGYLQIRVPSGHAAVDLARLPEGQEIEVGTPNGAFLIARPGYYRFDVDDDATRFSVRRGGAARVVPGGGGDEIDVPANQSVAVSGTETATVQRIALIPDDAWDRWNQDRTAQLGEAPRSAAYVPPDVAGVEDLDRYGDWRDTPKYGNVWVPRDVSSDWAPYSTGRWVWDGYYGWTWVDEAPWGWAPYHYGRWCWNDGYWGWAPGPVAVRPVYAPALVAFFGGPHVGVSVSVGTPFVSWVALGWGEPVVPWWGPRGFVGRPYWGGWGGPRYVNNVEIHNTTIVNVTNINRYDNFRNRRAVIGVDGNRFGRGRIEHVRVDPDRLRNLRPVRGELGIRPVRESLVPRSGRGERPPDRIQNRRVVATRAPQDPARQPRAAGLVREGTRRQAAAPRIVSPSGDRRGRGGETGRNAPPPMRGTERNAVGERREGVDRQPSGGERMQGRQRGGEENAASRAAVPPPSVERGRSQDVERGRSQERARGSADERVRMPATRDERNAPRDRTHEGSQRMSPPPPVERERGRDRERSEVRIPRNDPAAPVDRGAERSRDRNESRSRPEPRVERQVTPPPSVDRGDRDHGRERQRVQQPEARAPEPRPMEPSRREVAPPSYQQRQPQGDSGRSLREPRVDRGSVQQEQRVQRQPEPHVQRGGDTRPDRGGDNPRGESRGHDRSQRGKE